MIHELRLACRALLKQPGFTAVAILTMALGIGANSAIFTVVDAVMLRPLPFADPDRVVVVTERLPQIPTASVSPLNYEDVRTQAKSFASIGAYRNTTFNLSGGGEPERVTGKMMSANVLPMLGIAPALGRTFTAKEDAAGGDAVTLISHGLWQRRFGGRTDVLGERLIVDGRPMTIVGVLPQGFTLFQPADLFVPIGPFLAAQPDDRSWHPGLLPIARLKDGVALAQARTELQALAERLARAYPDTSVTVGMTATPAQELQVQGVRTALLVLLGAVGGVLLIACINLAGLLLARGLSRRRDVAVRIALGAGRARIVLHLIVESLLIGAAGGVVGLMLAAFGVPLLLQIVGTTLPRADAVTVDLRVVAVTFALALITGIACGLVPALQSANVDLRDSLSEGGRTGASGSAWQHRARTALVIAEIAVTVVLTIGAALLIRSFARLQQVDAGFDAGRALAADLPLVSVAYEQDAARTAAVDRLLERAAALPGVRGAAVTTQLPMAGGGAAIHFNIKGRPPAAAANWSLAYYRAVSGGYFETMGIPIRRGRGLTNRDRQGSPPVIVINESMARQFFGAEDPLGKRMQLGALPDPAFPWMEVVGIVADVRQAPDAEAKSEMYVPYAQFPDPVLRRLYMNVTLVVSAKGDPTSLITPVRAIVRDIDPNQPLANVRTLEDVRAAAVAQPKFRTLLLGLFAAMAVALAGIGVYGLLAHGVAQRRNEFGVRLALGASPADVQRLVLRQGITLAAIGIAIGLAASLPAVRALASVIFGVGLWDPVTWGAAVATLFAVAGLASWIPARRALRTDPVVALRG
ncbi:MAG TPA: ABC transporter permease [Vicinamibacterales bacterium]|nr:ABC transporter permease [Vicinamibacterales bacterium]